jgi:hypothetical protein
LIRLIHQFDDPRTRPLAASPKSEMCSCCCCCSVVTILGAGVLTARSVGRAPLPPTYGPRATPEPDGPYREAMKDALVTARPHTSRTGARVFGFFLLPLAILLGGLVATLEPATGICVGVGAYIAGLWYLVAKAALPGWVCFLVLLVPLVAAGEAAVWIATLFH